MGVYFFDKKEYAERLHSQGFTRASKNSNALCLTCRLRATLSSLTRLRPKAIGLFSMSGNAWTLSTTPQKQNMGRFQSGQMDQTVNLTSSTSVVRIHLCPPQKGHLIGCPFCLVEVIVKTQSYRWFARGGEDGWVGIFLRSASPTTLWRSQSPPLPTKRNLKRTTCVAVRFLFFYAYRRISLTR